MSVGWEQQLVPNVGVFARAGVANGQIEPYEFTDVDQTVVAGLSLSGKLWGRPDDTLGIAGIDNAISGVHQAFLNAGGLGILVGDGVLPHPGREKIIETYYKFPILSWQVTSIISTLPIPPTIATAVRFPLSARACIHSSERRQKSPGADAGAKDASVRG
jgi:hypothetical protein